MRLLFTRIVLTKGARKSSTHETQRASEDATGRGGSDLARLTRCEARARACNLVRSDCTKTCVRLNTACPRALLALQARPLQFVIVIRQCHSSVWLFLREAFV